MVTFQNLDMTGAVPCPALAIAPFLKILVEKQLHKSVVLVDLKNCLTFCPELVYIGKVAILHSHEIEFHGRSSIMVQNKLVTITVQLNTMLKIKRLKVAFVFSWASTAPL